MKQLLRVKVMADASKEAVAINPDGSYTIAVREEAKEGRANKRVKEILIKRLATVPGTRVIMIKGGRSPSKIFEIISNVTSSKNESR